MTDSVCLALVTSGSVRWETCWSFDQARKAQVFSDDPIFVQSGPYLDDARNDIVRTFLRDRTAERLLMVDSDIGFFPRDVAQLTEDRLPVASGVYWNVFEGQVKPVMALLPDMELSDDPLFEVAGCGAGFLMMSRQLLTDMGERFGEPQPWFAEPVFMQGGVPTHIGEDIEFCRRVREEMGEKIYCDLRVQLSHFKTIRITGPEDPGGPATRQYDGKNLLLPASPEGRSLAGEPSR